MAKALVLVQIRLPPDVHEKLASWAGQDKQSLNALIVGVPREGGGGSR